MRRLLLKRLRQLRRIRREESKSEGEEREAREELIKELDDPIRREAAAGMQGPPPGVAELADQLDGKEAETLEENWTYVAKARNQGRDPVQAFRQGWTPGSKSEGKSQDQDKDQDKDQDEDKSESEDKGRSWGYGGRGR